MKIMNRTWCGLIGLLVLCGVAHATEPTVAIKPALQILPAEHFSAAASAQMLAATRTGADKRIVAVGDHGVVMLSDDEGKTFRQAKAVPVRSTLTAVSFADRFVLVRGTRHRTTESET
ncbi:hypothetical protein ACVBEF_21080, partial [Glaciimonas sp. GG7]